MKDKLVKKELVLEGNKGPFKVTATPIQLWMYEQAGVDYNTYDPSRDQMTPEQAAWFKSVAGLQAMDFRDKHPFHNGLRYRQYRNGLTYVISTHRSKSHTLPVVLYYRPDVNAYVVVRDNFYNYKLSICTPAPAIRDELFQYITYTTPPVDPDYTGDSLRDCYFEGFPDELIFGYQQQAYDAGHGRWSCEVWGETPYRMTCFAIMRGLGFMKPKKWNTREEHNAELEEERRLDKLDREEEEREAAEASK